MIRTFILPVAISLSMAFLYIACNNQSRQNKTSSEEWVSLFNGKDLSGWDIKIKDHPLNENYKNTFRVENNILKISYDDYGKFDMQFGHLFTQKPYSYYKLRFEYRFHGNHLTDAPV